MEDEDAFSILPSNLYQIEPVCYSKSKEYNLLGDKTKITIICF